MEIKIENGKWNINNILLDIFINYHRSEKKIVRSKITKKNNCQFNFKTK